MTDELIGKTIGGYEILDVIGRGGMATVYRAQQVSMKRVVAVKVLPKQYIHDDTYLQRFNQEVKIVSQLEHRNIVPVYDYGEYEGQPYIVMRYMTAGSVDALVGGKNPLEIETIVSILEQIAPALDYAHGKSVLHRDLKPSNVLLDDDGGAYLTDFGIARILGEQSVGITTQGVVGTPSYMSPEQAQGLPLDNRSDIYALGVMLFEMATGRRPFESDTPYSIAVMQVTTPPPQPRSYNPALSFAVEEVILKALKKQREARYPHAVALAEALKRALDKPISSIHDTQPAMLRPSSRAAPVEAVQPPPMVVVPPISTYTPPPPAPSATPGSMNVYPRRRRARRPNIWMNAAVGGLIGCGLLVVLAIVVLLIIGSLAAGDGGVVPTIPPSEDNGPQVESALPTLDPTSQAARRTIVPLPTPTPTAAPPPIAPVGERTALPLPQEVRDTGGTLVYFATRGASTNLYRLNLETGEEEPLTFGTATDAYPAVSPDGQRVAFESNRDGDFDIYVMDVNGGNLRQLTRNDVYDRLASWSPDGEWIVFSADTRGDGTFDLYRTRPDGTDMEPLVANNARNGHPRWSPDGGSLVFTTGSRDDGGTWEIARLDLDADRVTPLTDNSVKDWAPVYSPDGRYILYLTNDGADGNAAIARMTRDGGEARILYDGPGYEWGVSYSPDGRYLAFTSQDEGREQVFIVSAEGGDAVQITQEGGQAPAWAR